MSNSETIRALIAAIESVVPKYLEVPEDFQIADGKRYEVGGEGQRSSEAKPGLRPLVLARGLGRV